MLESLNAIDNIGLDFSKGKVRIEPYEYFYQDHVLLDVSNKVSGESRMVMPDKLVQNLTIGYEKWEAETDNGLDGFHGKRQYVTQTQAVNHSKEILSKLIADGYAIEGTRRRQIKDASKDWKYDDNLFIIDLKRSGDDFEVNLGVAETKTVVNPETIYNARFSPARMAMRWRNVIAQGFKNRDLKFAGGEGYLNVVLLIEDSEYSNGKLIENEDIDISKYKYPEKDLDLFCAEEIIFEHPLTVKEFYQIQDNPYGLILFPNGEGWIKVLEYDPKEYLARFQLIIKNY